MTNLVYKSAVAVCIAGSSLLVSACGPSTGDSLASAPGRCEAMVSSRPSSIATPIPPAKLQFSSPVETDELAAGTRLTVTLGDSCISPGEITLAIPERFEGRTKSGVRSYEWTLPRTISKDELARIANDDLCVQSIGEARVDELPQSEAVAVPQLLPDDPKIAQQLHLPAIGTSEAFDIFFNPKNGITRSIVIAVIDSGVRLDHEDIRERLWVNKGEIPGNGRDDDENGYIDDVYGYNFASHRGDPSPQKTSANGAWQWAHGTRVSGLAAATSGNRIGVSGVAPNARIMALNAMGTGSGFSQATQANAIRYAVDNGAKVVNLSIGGNSGQTADFKNAIRYAISKGVVVLAAAGNEGKPIGSTYSAAGLGPMYRGLITIGNFQAATFAKSPTSNYSTTYVKLGAPGTYNTKTLLVTTSPESRSSYSNFSGTSASVPVASGAAALAFGLIQSRGYATSPALIENLLLESARKVSGLKRYFKDGNALNLASLARLIDQRYPQRTKPAPIPDDEPSETFPEPAPDETQMCHPS